MPAPSGSGSRFSRSRLRVAAGLLSRAVLSVPGRAVVSLVLLAAVLASIDLGAVADALDDAEWTLFAAAVAAVATSFVVAAVRWRLLLEGGGVPCAPLAALRAYFAGAFSNTLLPTGFGGDLVRAWMIGSSGVERARALGTVLFDRASALACLVAVGWIGVLADPSAVPGALVAALAGVSGLGAAGAALAVALLRRGGLGALLPAALRRWAAGAAAALRLILAAPALQVRVLGLGIAFQLLVVLALWLIAEALGLSLGFAVLAVVTPVVLVATVAPISIAGFGVREGAFVVLLDSVGVSAADATVLSLLSAAALALAALPGAASVLGGGRPIEAG